MNFTVQILGSNSALPVNDRHPSSQYIKADKQHILIDCGEGTQMQLSRYDVKRSRINTILISHLHGDHIYGLPGLIGSYAHHGRKSDLSIYGPYGIKKFLNTALEVSESRLNFEIKYHEFDPDDHPTWTLDDRITISSFPLKHRITCAGYLINYRFPYLNLRKDVIEKLQLPISEIKKAVRGQDVVLQDGTVIPNNEVAYQRRPDKSYAYCSDTAFDLEIIPFIKNVNLLYHETTYLDNLEEKALKYYHSTLGQAVQIAMKAGAGKLLTGHYSSRYRNLDEFIKAAEGYDIPILIGEEGGVYAVD